MQRIFRRGAFLSCLGVFLALVLCSQGSEAKVAGGLPPEYVTRHWATEDGLPQNTVHSIAQTPEGYVWVGTKGGLARYNGDKFTIFDAKRLGFEPVSYDFRQLVTDGEGVLWIRSKEQIICRRDGWFRAFSAKRDLNTDDLRTMAASRGGGVWVGTKEGLLRIGREKIERFFSDVLDVVDEMSEDREGNLWIETEGHMVRFDPRTGRGMRMPEVLGSEIFHARSLFHDSKGRYWVCSTGGLFYFEENAWHALPGSEPLSLGWSSVIQCEDQSGALWVGTYSDVRRLKDGRSEAWGRKQGMPSDDIRCVFEDREGSLWMGTGDSGVCQLRAAELEAFTKADGLHDDDIQSVSAGASGAADGDVSRLWVGSMSGLSSGTNGIFQAFSTPLSSEFARNNKPAPILEDHSGTVWLGLDPYGLFCWEDGRAVRQVLDPRREKNRITALAEDNRGELFVGTEHGLFCRTNGEFARLGAAEGLANEFVMAIQCAPDGSVWVGSYGGGVTNLRRGSSKVYSTNEHLLSNIAGPVHVEPDGAVWISTPKGLNRIRNGQVASVTVANGLFDNSPFAMLPDDQGRFWFNCSRGIFCVKQKELESAADGNPAQIHSLQFGGQEGNGDFQPNACRTSDGKLWFASTKGLIMVDPSRVRENEVLPPVVIEQVKVGGQIVYEEGQSLLTSAATIRVGPKVERGLEIHYTGNSFVAPGKVRYQYRLEPREKEWVEAEDRRYAIYTGLPPGNYRFRVKACNNHGHWNEAARPLGFVIVPRFTETPLFYFMLGGAALSLGIILHRFRLGQQRQVQALEHELAFERERSRIAQDIHDDVGASLTRIQLLSQVVEGEAANRATEEVKAHAQEIATTARSVVQRMDEIVWAVNPANDTLASFVDYVCHATEELFQGTGVRCRFDIQDSFGEHELASETRHDLFLLMKEALHNALKHSEGSEVTLRLWEEKDHLAIEIEDGGPGFDSQSATPGRNGLRNMRERARRLGGTCEIQSNLGVGTKVRFTIPLA